MSLNRGIYILWLMCLLAFNHTCGQQVTMLVQSTGYSHLYKDEPIDVTCTASGNPAAELVGLVNGTTDSDPYYGCSYSAGKWRKVGEASYFPWLTEIEDVDCAAFATIGAQSPPFTLSLKGQVSEAMVGLNLNCLAYFNGAFVFSTDSGTISEIRVVPPGPLTLDEPKIAEGKPFNFSCSPSTASPGAQPASEYSYEVLRYDGMTVANTNTYTPVEADRDGITLKCTDTVHYDALKDKYPNRVVMETKLQKPWFLVNNGEENRDTPLSPATDYTLTCDVSGYPVAQITYSWICDGCTSTDTTSVLIVPNGPRTSGQTDTISCTANLPSLAPVTITWNITWDDDAPLPTQGSGGIEPVDGGGDDDDNNNNKVLSDGAIAGIVVAVLIACGCSGGVVVFIYKRKNKPSINPSGANSQDGDPTDNGDKKKNGKDVERTPMNTQSSNTQSNMPGKPLHQKSTKKQKSEPKPKVHDRPAPPPQPELVYAEVDHSQTKAKFIQPKPNPPPQESVEYACIDINATKNFRTNGDTYENTGNSRGNSSPTIPKSKAPLPPGVV